MEKHPDLIKIHDEVLRKIGRNLLNFQKIEFILKKIITISHISGHASNLQQNHERRASKINNQMMGNLVGQFFEETLSNSNNLPNPITELNEPHISISFNLNVDENFYEIKKKELKALVDDRNDLIHHLLPKLDTTSIQSCLEVEQYLDDQRERLIPQYDYLQSIIKIIADQINILSSEEVRKQFELSILQKSDLVSRLQEIAFQQCREDGWTSMNHAGHYLRKNLPDAIEQLESKYGHKTLKRVMLASELFDFFEEPTKSGGQRLLYRTKPELANDS